MLSSNLCCREICYVDTQSPTICFSSRNSCKCTCHRRKYVYSEKLSKIVFYKNLCLRIQSMWNAYASKYQPALFWKEVSNWDLKYFLPLLGLEIIEWSLQCLWIMYSTTAGCLGHIYIDGTQCLSNPFWFSYNSIFSSFNFLQFLLVVG